MQKTWKFKLGIVLLIVCVIAFLSIPVVPFLDLGNSVKITLSTVLLVIGEITFWTGGLLLGKELFNKYKAYFNPKNWFKSKSINIITMKSSEKTKLTVQVTIHAPIEKVWNLWTDPNHIIKWNNASDDWHTPRAENDLRAGGKFLSRMEAKDGSFGFDFSGTYTNVEPLKKIEYTLEDERNVQIIFVAEGDKTTVTETFEAEQENSEELQQAGWQSILDNFKKYTEAFGKLETLHFELIIDAKTEKVYSTMIHEQDYRKWTAAFSPTSHFKGSWEKGAKIVFLGTDENGNTGGMVSRIKENTPNRFVSIEHLGFIQGEEEITSGPEVEGWAGALENYTFKEVNGKTLISVDLDVNQEFKSYFADTWPKALIILKEICEQ